MGRITREVLLYKGCFAHIFTRAIEKRKIFEKLEDFEFFKIKMAEIKKEYEFKVFHYCLMQTHVHMVVEIPDLSRFSEGMKALKKAYAHRYNTSHKRFGAVWRDRYKAKIIEDESYLNACGKYVENNPVEAGMVERAVDWPHSSSRHYELGVEDVIIDQYDCDGVRSTAIWESNEFERMRAIGSEWFQYQIWRKVKG
jgi:REP element-mobilizing transposase RayT